MYPMAEREESERSLLSQLRRLQDESERLIREHDRVVVKEFDRIHQQLEELRKRTDRVN